MKYRDLLIEIGTEELPPKSLLALADTRSLLAAVSGWIRPTARK